MGIVASCVARILPSGLRGSENGQLSGATTTLSGGHSDIEDGISVVQRANNGTYFGTHFLMGGERFDIAKPDTFLFGDNSDLELMGTKPVDYPYHVRGFSHPFKVLNALINVRRDSVKFVKVDSEQDSCYRLEFIFDADTDCYVQIHFFAKEFVEGDKIHFISKGKHESSNRVSFTMGADQVFDQYLFFPQQYNFPFHYEGGSFFPIVIEVRSIANVGRKLSAQVQATFCSIERSSDQTAAFILKPLKQKLIVDGVTYLMQEIYGIENKEKSSRTIDDNSAECIICMGNPRDTVILPCRHLCICCGCAEALRFKLQNCPICRSPFKALFRFSPANLDGLPNQPSRITLVEALNGGGSTVDESTQPESREANSEPVFHASKTKHRKNRGAKTLNRQPSTADSNVVEIEMQPMSLETSEISSIAASVEEKQNVPEAVQLLPEDHAKAFRVMSDVSSTKKDQLEDQDFDLSPGPRPPSKSAP
ncbi:hypothetical protein FO519_001423 [Halicephalobus sp. NKZ332]|nr:hypothetical protein FO519_001423 [Halicephalobus sp. NKZ332]